MVLTLIKSLFFPEVPVNDERLPICEAHPVESLPGSTGSNSNIFEANNSLLSEVFMSFKQSEIDIKSVELESYGEDLNIPSINELRYAGHHLCKALKAEIDQDDQAEELKRALRHCHRASYDAVELGIIAQLETIRDFQRSSSGADITKHWPDYLENMQTVEAGQKFIQQQSVKRERESYFEGCNAHYTELAKIVTKITTVNTLLAADRRSARRGLFWRVFSYFTTVIITAIFTIALTLLQVIPYEKLQKTYEDLSTDVTKEKISEKKNFPL